MPTNLALDDKLIERARRIGRHRTKKAAVTAALEEYVRYRKQLRILDPLPCQGGFDGLSSMGWPISSEVGNTNSARNSRSPRLKPATQLPVKERLTEY